MIECTCEIPEKVSFCRRHNCEKSRRMVELCQMGQRGEEPGVSYWQAWEEGRRLGQWTPDMPSRGLGDTIAKTTHAVGIEPCNGCRDRQNRLNQRFPYRRQSRRGGPMFIRLQDLQLDTKKLASRLPSDLSAVVGIARSGLMPASILSTMLHLPLYSVSRAGVVDLGYGTRLGERGAPNGRSTVLLVDDTAFAGTAMRTYPAILERAFPGVHVLKAVIYASAEAHRLVDFYSVLLPKPHWLEWHWFNSPMVARAAFDFDGILCHDPEPGEDDDGPRYREFLRRAQPLYVPRHTRIPLVVTARLDRPEYRRLTQEWLARWRITAGRLVMGPWSSVRARNPRSVARFKANQYRQSKLSLFVESDPKQAEAIAAQTGKRVLCPAAGKVF